MDPGFRRGDEMSIASERFNLSEPLTSARRARREGRGYWFVL